MNNKLTLMLAFSEHLFIIPYSSLLRRGLFASLRGGDGEREGGRLRLSIFPSSPVRLLIFNFYLKFYLWIPAGASAEERVRVLKLIFQLVVKLDGLKMCQFVKNSTESN